MQSAVHHCALALDCELGPAAPGHTARSTPDDQFVIAPSVFGHECKATLVFASRERLASGNTIFLIDPAL